MRTILLCFFSLLPSAFVVASSNNLNKIIYNKGFFFDSIVCFFDKRPECKVSESQQDKSQQVVEFFLPDVCLNCANSKDVIQQINGADNKAYTVSMAEAANASQKGVNITVKYDRNKVSWRYASHISMKLHEGIIFTFHNMQVIKPLQEMSNPMLHTVQNESTSWPYLNDKIA